MPEEKNNSVETKSSIIKDFYLDVDKIKKKRGTCCTCYSFAIVVILVIISLSIVAVIGLRRITKPNFSKVDKIEPSQTSLTSIKEKLDNLVDKNNKDNGVIVSITISQEELTSLMNQNQGNDFPMKEITAKIDETGVEISGKYQRDLLIIKNISVDLIVLLEPIIKGEKLTVNIKNIEAGDIKINQKISDRIGTGIEKFVDSKINREDVTYETIVLSKGQMILTGRQK